MLVDLKAAKTVALEAELQAYRDADVKVAESKELKNNAARVAEIERLVKEHGILVKIDEQFLKENPTILEAAAKSGDDIKVGESVFFTQEELDASNRAEASKLYIDELTKAGVALKGTETLEELVALKKLNTGSTTAGEVKPPVTKAKGAATTTKAEKPDLIYNGKTVVGITNVLFNGKSYKDVKVASGETFRLNTDEFNKDVTPRKVHETL